jgi:uncharacterized protein
MTIPETEGAAEQMLFGALEALKNGDVKPWTEMFHGDGVMEFPYALPGAPKRLEGRAAIADYIRPYPERIAIQRVTRRAVQHSGGVMVAEFACQSTALATGIQVEMEYVSVITLEGGRIKHYRDYWNPLVAVEAMGGTVTMSGTQPA